MIDDAHTRNLARMMDVASIRARVIAGNLANQNTPGYRAKAVAFEDAFTEALDQGQSPESVAVNIFEPRDTSVGVDGNDVDPDREVLAGSENAFIYNAYASILRGRHKLIDTALTSAP